MKKFFKKTMHVLIIAAIIGPVFAISIDAIAADNPCNPPPEHAPDGRQTSTTCRYLNMSYTFNCCDDNFTQEWCTGFIQVCPEPQPSQ